VADAVALALALGLAMIPYNFGTGRWSSEWTRSVRGLSLLIFGLFMPWFVVAVGIGANGALVPVAMLLFVGGFGVGYFQYWRRVRSRRST
jgi:hypothetical protein